MAGNNGSAYEDATTYGMPKRETESRLKQHTHLYNKAKKKSDAADKAFHANPTLRGVLKSRKANKKTSAIAKSGNKLVQHKKKFSKKPYGSEKGYN